MILNYQIIRKKKKKKDCFQYVKYNFLFISLDFVLKYDLYMIDLQSSLLLVVNESTCKRSIHLQSSMSVNVQLCGIFILICLLAAITNHSSKLSLVREC